MGAYSSQLDRWGLDSGAQFLLCLAIDGIGMAGILLPGIGWFFDAGWAGVQALFVFEMLSNDPAVGTYATLSFAEEIIPFVDVVPSCTIAWMHKFAGVL